MNLEIAVAVIVGFVFGAGVSLALGRAKFANLQTEAREQIDSLQERVNDLTAAASAKIKKVTRKR